MNTNENCGKFLFIWYHPLNGYNYQTAPRNVCFFSLENAKAFPRIINEFRKKKRVLAGSLHDHNDTDVTALYGCKT